MLSTPICKQRTWCGAMRAIESAPARMPFSMSITIRQYEAHDFTAMHKLDQACFPPGISYSKMMLRYYLAQPGAECLVAVDEKKIVGFVISEENPPLGHIIQLVARGPSPGQ